MQVTKKWQPEIQQHAPGVPILLVGTKFGLARDEASEEKLKARAAEVSAEEARACAEEIGAKGYTECSAMTQEALGVVFEEAIRIAIMPKPAAAFRGRKGCVVL